MSGRRNPKPRQRKPASVGRNMATAMTISFDLDDTLIPITKAFATERQNTLQKLLKVEKIRLGAKRLIEKLKSQKHKVYIYTTSFRSTNRIRWTLLSYGITVDRIINQKIHNQVLQTKAGDCSKLPPAFAIDIHIDDSEGLAIEGAKFNFKTIILPLNQPDWIDYILENLDKISSGPTNS